MRNTKLTLVAATGLALSLAACGDEPDTVNDMNEESPVVETPVMATEFNPLERDYDLSPEARERRAEFDMDEFNTEYRRIRDEQAQSGTSAGTGAMNGGTAPGDTATSNTGSSMPERSEMDWTYLDRNSDGRLSVAEYAVWAIPVDPNAPKPNDETKPYVTADQANKAADSFFYYDQDGDSYLSQVEFNNARRGGEMS